ncbi:peptide chain release factor-like protein [Opitutaceae bacterium]
MDLPPVILERLAALGVAPSDVEERFVLGSGPGGQKINKTSSTVCLRHLPTGMEVRCQQERSQSANRVTAWIELCRRLEDRRRLVAERIQHERERARRQTRQKSRTQKKRMLADKRHHAGRKAARRHRPDE